MNLVDRVLEVRRNPSESAVAPYGWDYREVTLRRAGDVVSALAAPHAEIAVTDLLP